MIVETMSYEEMAQESNRIIETYSKRVKDRFSPGQPEFNKLKRYMLKHKTSRNVKGDLVKYKISTTNTFYSIPLILNYKSFKILKRIIQIPFITYVNSHGMNVITDIESSENKLEFLFFTSHFFRRYEERFGLMGHSRIDNIVHLFARSDGFMLVPFPTAKNPGNLIGGNNHVIFFGEQLCEHFFMIKTCIRHDQLYSKQEEITDDIDEVFLAEAKRQEKILNPVPSHTPPSFRL